MKSLIIYQKEFYILLLLLLISIFYKKKLFSILFISIIIFLTFFYRVPEISYSNNINHLISPCNGKIIKIEKQKNSYKLYMFLSAFDPHIQLIPYDGKITKYEFIEGEYQLAYKLEKDNYRTRFITHIDTKHGNIEIIQNTGMITRRIKNNFNNNDKVDKGSILGIIKFGSRVDITIPNTFKLQFKLHDDVLLGQTLAVL